MQDPISNAAPSNRDGFKIAVICALPEERDTVEALMTKDYRDEGRQYGKAAGDENSYTLGELGGKPVVLVAPRDMGVTNTRELARQMRFSFPSISYALLVGICGGAPFVRGNQGWAESDIHLGDVIVSTQIIQFDLGREYENGFARKKEIESVLPRAPAEVTNFVNRYVRGRGKAFGRLCRGTNSELSEYNELETGKGEFHAYPGPGNDRVYDRELRHKHHEAGQCTKCDECTEWHHEVCDAATQASCEELGCQPGRVHEYRDTKIHFGRYASGNMVIKSAHRRDALVQEEKVIGFEMEGAGAWEVLPTIVIKGVVDYADSHKNKRWRGYPAARAALCAKTLIEEIELADLRDGHASASALVTSQETRQSNPRDIWLAEFAGQLVQSSGSVSDARKLIERISTYQPLRTLNRILSRRLEGTTEWLVKLPEIAHWRSTSEASATIWLLGKVGSGKTFAMAGIIEHLLVPDGRNMSATVIHYFFQYPNYDAVSLFKSLLKQLLEALLDSSLACPRETIEYLELCFGADNRTQDCLELVDHLIAPLLSRFKAIYCCIDGLEDCSYDDQQQIWAGLERLQRRKKIKLFLTGRDGVNVPCGLSMFRLRMDQGANAKAIEAYIKFRIAELGLPDHILEDEVLRESIQSELVAKADGMFLWAHLQIEGLSCCENQAELREALANLPPTIEETYMRFLTRKRAGKPLCEPRILKWAAAACEPITVGQVCEMLAIDATTGDFYHGRKPTVASVLRSTVSLLSVAGQERALVPVHHSARQFLFSDKLNNTLEKDDCALPTEIRDNLGISKREALRNLADLSMRHLQSRTSLPVQRTHLSSVPQVQTFLPKRLRKVFSFRYSSPKALWRVPVVDRSCRGEATAFYNYALQTWIRHTSVLERKDSCWQVFEDFAMSIDISPSHQPWCTESLAKTPRSYLLAMFGYAVAHNHLPLVWLVLDRRRYLPPDIFGPRFNLVLPGNELVPALHFAAGAGYTRMFRFLNTIGRFNWKCPKQGRTPLHYAALNGHIDAWLEVERDFPHIDFDAVDDNGCTPMFLAVEAGHIRFAEYLLNTGKVIPDPQNLLKERPLFKAAEAGHDGLVEMLLATEAVDVNAKNKDSKETALWSATKNGHLKIVKLLLRTGRVDLASQSAHQSRTLLHAAASSGDVEIIQTLLTVTAKDVDSRDTSQMTPLMVAATLGHAEVVRALLRDGQADPAVGEAQCRSTALSLAASNGHLPVVRLLFESGRVDAAAVCDRSGSSVLGCAASQGSLDVVDYLLEVCEVPPDPKNDYDETPFSVAVAFGHCSVTARLLSTGACDVNIAHKETGQTPLLRATINRCEHVIGMLLDHDEVDLNRKCFKGTTVLTHATESGQHRVVGMLLSSGRVDINLADSHGFTALHIAAKSGFESLVERLLATGEANVNLRDEDGKTPLASAVTTGRVGAVERLLEVDHTDASIPDRWGQSPLTVARKYQRHNIVKLLERRLKVAR